MKERRYVIQSDMVADALALATSVHQPESMGAVADALVDAAKGEEQKVEAPPEYNRKAEAQESWPVARLLEVFGLRIKGGSFKDATEPAGPGRRTDDDEMQAVRYVENTPGFLSARDVLVWVHVYFRPLETYRLILPGEDIFLALQRTDMYRHYFRPFVSNDVSEIPRRAYAYFMAELEKRWSEEPFYPVRELEEPDAMELGAKASRELKERILRGFLENKKII